MSRIFIILDRLRTLWAVGMALAIGALLIRFAGKDPWIAYGVLFHEAFVDYWGFANTLVKACPIILAALAVALPYRAGLFNIGGEGQIYIGGLFATVAGLNLPDVSPPVGIVLILVAGAFGGGIWAGIAGMLRAHRDVNEVVVTLLLNFVAIYIVSYAVNGPMMAIGAPYPYSEELPASLHLPLLLAQTDVHLGLLLALVLAVSLHVHFTRTTHGHALDIIGRNAKAAQYAGIAVKREIVSAMVAGGAIAGLAGGIEIAGVKYRLFHLFSSGYGFDGVVVAFMAGAQPLLIPFAGIFIAGLKAGAGGMQRIVGIDSTIVEAIRGLIVMFVAVGLSRRQAQAHQIGGWRLLERLVAGLASMRARSPGP